MVDSPHKIYNSEILGVESAESLVILLLHFMIKQRPLVESIKRGQISNLAVIVVQMYVGIIQSNPQDFWGLDSKPQKSWGLDDRRDMNMSDILIQPVLINLVQLGVHYIRTLGDGQTAASEMGLRVNGRGTRSTISQSVSQAQII